MACKLLPGFLSASLTARRVGSFGVRAEERDVAVGWFRATVSSWSSRTL
jgi:hypothetical protein